MSEYERLKAQRDEILKAREAKLEQRIQQAVNDALERAAEYAEMRLGMFASDGAAREFAKVVRGMKENATHQARAGSASPECAGSARNGDEQ